MQKTGDIPNIPTELPISGKKGSDRLGRLKRRAEFLGRRIEQTGLTGGSYDKGELSALQWAIVTILQLEKEVRCLRANQNEPPT